MSVGMLLILALLLAVALSLITAIVAESTEDKTALMMTVVMLIMIIVMSGNIGAYAVIGNLYNCIHMIAGEKYEIIKYENLGDDYLICVKICPETKTPTMAVFQVRASQFHVTKDDKYCVYVDGTLEGIK